MANTYQITVSIKPEKEIETDYVDLTFAGLLTIKKGYAWDDPSGTTIDTKNFMRGSLVHDALYQLMCDEYINKDKWRAEADLELKRICIEDGMSKIRAWYVHWAVQKAAAPAADPSHRKVVQHAP